MTATTEPGETAVDARICDATLSFELKGYQAMSKTEHSQHSRDIMAALLELTEYRAAYATDETIAALGRDAERYRWLRSRLIGADFEWGEPKASVLVFQMHADMRVSPQLDATIDAALRQAETEGGG